MRVRSACWSPCRPRSRRVTYAFGPGVIGVLRDLSGSYTVPFYACIALELIAAMLIMIAGAQERFDVQPPREHRKRAVGGARPHLLPVLELDAVSSGSRKYSASLTPVAGAVERNACA